MYQMRKLRDTADEKDICVECSAFTKCNHKPENNWRYILIQCQFYEGESFST